LQLLKSHAIELRDTGGSAPNICKKIPSPQICFLFEGAGRNRRRHRLHLVTVQAPSVPSPSGPVTIGSSRIRRGSLRSRSRRGTASPWSSVRAGLLARWQDPGPDSEPRIIFQRSHVCGVLNGVNHGTIIRLRRLHFAEMSWFANRRNTREKQPLKNWEPSKNSE
jgi:hypothetical protein